MKFQDIVIVHDERCCLREMDKFRRPIRHLQISHSQDLTRTLTLTFIKVQFYTKVKRSLPLNDKMIDYSM